ncbi:MAG: formate dehydrogenase accessory sulfurtransferase FdhD [Lunatimonas sp.]|uniref:formate dehydrogenase accessory sulfurtransferase FdhD n=1 Tax=Lunatimonas sp. TaxID=2060141 RepID=UPI00263AD95D|nr:formate dehydrogenase accessory sulfurtransferase FdhD [Lunatimonas sp.]MCC5939310.1 formate dehydrogenase accessory sulfurtransferase FdhD [Lunatimonas sp.]
MTKLIAPVKKLPVYTVERNGNSIQAIPDLVAVEEPLQIRLQWERAGNWQEKNLYVTMRTPGHDFDLAMGFLLAEGIIQRMEDVLFMRYCKRVKVEEEGNVVIVRLAPDTICDLSHTDRNFLTNSSCGVCGKSSIDAIYGRLAEHPIAPSAVILPEVVYVLSSYLDQEQTGFKYTGGLHAAGLFDLSGQGLLVREDVGRHNALDKLVGASYREGLLPNSSRIVLLSGRVSFELVQKTAVAGVSVLAALGAPSSLAIDLAQKTGITLIGFLKKDRFNCYSHPERIHGVGGKNSK